MSADAEKPVLHIWAAPDEWGVPAREPASLAALLILQLSAPGRFVIARTFNPDTSPSGTLPYLAHGHHAVPGLAAITRYMVSAQLSTDSHGLDAHLSPVETAQRTAWAAHIESGLGDLVTHAFFCLPDNWKKLTHPALASGLPIPQRYYVPFRVRESYQPRLEAAGLWDAPEEVSPSENEPKSFAERQKKQKEELPGGHFRQKFGREKVIERARAYLDVYDRALRSKSFLFGDRRYRPTSLDALLAAHVLLLTEPPFPDALLRDLVRNSYPTLLHHARRVRSHAFPSGSSDLQLVDTPTSSLGAFLPWPWAGEKTANSVSKEREQVERSYALQRWAWIGTAVVATAIYVAMFVQIRLVPSKSSEEDSDGQDEDSVGDDGDDDPEESDPAAAEVA